MDGQGDLLPWGCAARHCSAKAKLSRCYCCTSFLLQGAGERNSVGLIARVRYLFLPITSNLQSIHLFWVIDKIIQSSYFHVYDGSVLLCKFLYFYSYTMTILLKDLQVWEQVKSFLLEILKR